MTTELERLRDHAREAATEPTTIDTEAQLWTQIADEIDEWLDGTTNEPRLLSGVVGWSLR